jgi:hypothetical protein
VVDARRPFSYVLSVQDTAFFVYLSVYRYACMQGCSTHLLTFKILSVDHVLQFEDTSVVCFHRIRKIVYLENPALVFELVPTFGHPLVTHFFHLRRCWSRPCSCGDVPFCYSSHGREKAGEISRPTVVNKHTNLFTPSVNHMSL